MPTVHPTRLNVNSVFGRVTRLGGCCRLKLLNNDDWFVGDSTPTQKSTAEAVESTAVESKAVESKAVERR